ncbi:putative protein N(5)-glutamine methyltransferase [Cellulomonas sp. HZM]|uniref:putative protein N(5)-glutamine methyltransferase n=1 Tax=Cellulomonas sp. HZM TaxID=1454010 RepID=UPI0012DE3508|nr:putative protein N(5)-glutamine methyltransferase [Cellulomonas sp. HZM]
MDRDALVARLRAAGCVFAEDEADELLAEPHDDLAALVARRVAGEPLEQVLGWARFDGLRVLVAPGVFVPRLRTELVVREVLHALRDVAAPLVVDLCCGTGAIGLALRTRVPGAVVHAADVDPVAVACARRNLGPDDVHEGDLFDALPSALLGRVDAVAVNAPYVPTAHVPLMPAEARDHEHRIALDGGDDGLDLHRRVLADARRWLAPGGTVVVETSRAQSAATLAVAHAAGLRARVVEDDDVDGTVVVARQPT